MAQEGARPVKRSSGNWRTRIALAFAAAVPALLMRGMGHDPGPGPSVAVYGGAVVGAAFLLTWAVEAAQVDISAGLALALLALVAVLPEYAVDLIFAYGSGSRPEYAPCVLANMTGSNRLLAGLGWPLVVLVCAFTAGRRGRAAAKVVLGASRRVELGYLAVASFFALLVPAAGRLSILHSVVLVALYAFYVRRVTREEKHEADLIGVAARLGALPARSRRGTVAFMFVSAAAFIALSAGPFADSLVEAGREFGIGEFLLVQWIAPVASESPELVVAVSLALRGNGDMAVGALLSSMVNQWTLLVGSLPLAHALGGGGFCVPLDGRQTSEICLTSAQALLAFSLVADLRLGPAKGLALLALFLFQLAFPDARVRLFLSIVCLAAALVLLFRNRRSLGPVFRELR
jgi:cation:H+ antiporter